MTPDIELNETLSDRLIRIGREILKRNTPTHSITVSKPKNGMGSYIHVSIISVRAAIKEQFPHLQIITVDNWPNSFKVYLYNADDVARLDKKYLTLADKKCYMYVQNPIDGVHVQVSQIPSIWNEDDVRKLFSEISPVTSVVKNDGADGVLHSTATVVFAKAPAFLIENSSIKIDEAFPAIRWRFPSKTTCRTCHTVGHFTSQCSYDINSLPESIVKKNKQKEKVLKKKRDAELQSKKLDKEASEWFEVPANKNFEVTEDFHAVKKISRKNTPKSDNTIPNNSSTIENSTNVASVTIESPAISTSNGFDALPLIEETSTEQIVKTVEKVSPVSKPTTQKPVIGKETISKPKTANTATKASAAPVNKLLPRVTNSKAVVEPQSSKNPVSTLSPARTRAASSPDSPDNEITLKSKVKA